MDILKPFVLENDYNGFEKKFNTICGTSPNHCREAWNAIQKVYIPLQICRDDVHKIAIDAFRPLISKQNETILPTVLPKMKSFLKGDHGPLTRKKVEKFIDKARGICKLPPQNNKLVRCGFPGCMKGAYKPAIVEGVPVCPDHNEAIQKDPSLIKKLLAPPQVPERTTKKTYDKIPLTWEERQALMRPRESKMDWEMYELLKNDPKVKEHGYKVEFQKEYILLTTISDVTLVKDGDEIAVYWDHVETHKNRGERDPYLRGLLEKRHHGTRAVGFDYKDNTKKSVEELLRKVHGELR